MKSTITVNGMGCEHCINAVTKALNDIGGIRNVEVNLDKGEATFESDSPIDREKIKDSIENAGYELG
jgi:copper chaperone